MKLKLLAAAAAAALLLTSCAADNALPPQETEHTTSTTSASTTTTTTEATTTPPPEPVYSDDCEAYIERFAISGENRYMTSPMEYGIDGENGVLSVSIDYYSYVDIYTLQNCILDISVTEGEHSVDEAALNPDGTVDLTKLTEIVLTDGEGLKRKYDIVTERTFYDLPIVNIYLDDMTGVNSIGRNTYTGMTFFIDAAGADASMSTDVISGGIRGRGHSTWSWAKKPYRIKLDESVSVLGLDKNKDWILLANYSDKSFLRNIVAYNMGHDLDGLEWSPTQYPVDLFVNGEYRGVYTIGEHMEVGNGRVNIDEDSADADTGYLLEIGGSDDDDELNVDFFHTAQKLAKFIVIKSPDEDVITDEQKEYIRNYLNETEKAIVSGVGYEDYIDVDSFCDWIIIHELTYNADSCFRRSCYMTKDRGGKLHMGPIWDFDLAFANCNMDNQNYNDWVTVGYGTSYDDAYVIANWCNYLMDNADFRSRIRERWFEVRDRLLDTAMKSIDFYSDKIYRSQEQNYQVWQVWGTKVGYQSNRNAQYETYELQIQYLKDYLTARAEWIDNNI